MTEKIFKAYLDMVVEKAFKEGVCYERDRVKFHDEVISMKEAIENAKVNILGE